MSTKLEDFLGLSDISEIRDKITEKIGDKEFEFVIRPITQVEHSEFQKRSNIIHGKSITFDTGKYNRLALESCIVEPDFRNTEFLKKAGCASASEFLNKKFPAGILADIAQKIQSLSGFETFEQEIEDAKN